MASLSDLSNAIARFEGYSIPGSVAQRNNNPGNLRAGIGQTGTDGNGYAIFPDSATGFAALQHQVTLNINRGLSLDEFFGGKPGVYAGYAPSGDANDPGHYSQTVAGWLGIDPNAPLSDVIGTSGGSSTPGSGSDFSPIDTGGLFTFSTDVWGLPYLESLSGSSWLALAALAALGLYLISRD